MLTRRAALLASSAMAALIAGPARPAFVSFIAASNIGPTGFPGQSGNLVGFAATPTSTPAAFTTANGQTWPGAYSSLTAWPGGTGAQTLSGGTNATSGAGTAGNPWVFAFYDFDALTSGTLLSLTNAIFVGCRFQSNQVNNYNVAVTGSNVTFIYCSFVPRTALWTSPPNGAWPSAGSGLGIKSNSASYTNTGGYCVPSSDGYQFGVSISTGSVILDHCDLWGFGNAVNYASSSTSAMTVSDCWIHDAANCNVTPPGGSTNYHTDGPGYLNGGIAPSNITIKHNTIASIGNTNGLAFQATTATYSNISVTNNYFSGFADVVDMCHTTSGSTNLTFTDNIISTNLAWLNGPIYFTSGAANDTLFTIASNPTNLWRRNKLDVPAGTAQYVTGVTQANNGNYIWPDSTLSTSDWSN